MRWIIPLSLSLLLLTSCSKDESTTTSAVQSAGDGTNPFLGSNSQTMVVPESDISAAEAASLNMITEDGAKQVALRRAGFNESQTQGYQSVILENNGVYEYQITFWVDTVQYFYTIHGSDGSVLAFSTVFHQTGYVEPEQEYSPEIEPEEEFVASQGNLTAEEVKLIATNHANISVCEIYGFQITQGFNGSIPQYQVNFTTENANYQYFIAANTGTIFSSTKEDIQREDDFFLTLPEDTTTPAPDYVPTEPEVAVPDVTVPDVATPESDTTVPETSTPEPSTPESNVPPVYGAG